MQRDQQPEWKRLRCKVPAWTGVAVGALLAIGSESALLGQDGEIYRCPQEDGTTAFQGMPCEEPSDATDDAPADAQDDTRPDSSAASGEDPFDFVNPYDQPASALPPTPPVESSGRSEARAACEKETRDAIDAIDVEMRKGFSEAEGEAYLAELLELTQAKADGSYHKQLKLLAKVQLLVIDDWGLEPLKPAHRNDMMEIMDDRHGHASTLMISQLPTDQWYASIGDNTLADAILDRLMHNAHRLQLKGESMRKRMADLTDDEHPG